MPPMSTDLATTPDTPQATIATDSATSALPRASTPGPCSTSCVATTVESLPGPAVPAQPAGGRAEGGRNAARAVRAYS